MFEIIGGEDMPPPRRNLEEDAGTLYDFLVARPEGITWEDVREELGFPARNWFFKVVRRLRLILGDDDEMTVVCDPRGTRQTWLYRIVGDPQEAYGWQANRIGDMESRLETVLAVSTSVARNTDGRTMAGKKSRRIKSTVGYLLNELSMLKDDFGDE